MRRLPWLLALLVLSAPVLADAVITFPVTLGRYSRPTLTILGDGRVAIIGGSTVANAIDLFDPIPSSFTRSTAVTSVPRIGHSATLLRDGRVLIAGGGYYTDGRPSFGTYGDNTLEVYDPATDRLTKIGQMLEARTSHTATMLRDGTILFAGGAWLNIGGFHVWKSVTNGAEIYDPATGTSRPVGPMFSRRSEHTATLLADGRVLLFGGVPETDATPAAEIYDPVTSTFSPMTVQGSRVGHTSTLLPDGRVLIVGGLYDVALLLDASTANVTIPTAIVSWRRDHTATLLADGTVLLLGGGANAIVYDPAIDKVRSELPAQVGLERHTSVLLSDGRVFTAGGSEEGASLYVRSRSSRRRAVR